VPPKPPKTVSFPDDTGGRVVLRTESIVGYRLTVRRSMARPGASSYVHALTTGGPVQVACFTPDDDGVLGRDQLAELETELEDYA
jgi:hypothetical protein